MQPHRYRHQAEDVGEEDHGSGELGIAVIQFGEGHTHHGGRLNTSSMILLRRSHTPHAIIRKIAVILREMENIRPTLCNT